MFELKWSTAGLCRGGATPPPLPQELSKWTACNEINVDSDDDDDHYMITARAVKVKSLPWSVNAWLWDGFVLMRDKINNCHNPLDVWEHNSLLQKGQVWRNSGKGEFWQFKEKVFVILKKFLERKTYSSIGKKNYYSTCVAKIWSIFFILFYCRYNLDLKKSHPSEALLVPQVHAGLPGVLWRLAASQVTLPPNGELGCCTLLLKGALPYSILWG